MKKEANMASFSMKYHSQFLNYESLHGFFRHRLEKTLVALDSLARVGILTNTSEYDNYP